MGHVRPDLRSPGDSHRPDEAARTDGDQAAAQVVTGQGSAAEERQIVAASCASTTACNIAEQHVCIVRAGWLTGLELSSLRLDGKQWPVWCIGQSDVHEHAPVHIAATLDHGHDAGLAHESDTVDRLGTAGRAKRHVRG